MEQKGRLLAAEATSVSRWRVRKKPWGCDWSLVLPATLKGVTHRATGWQKSQLASGKRLHSYGISPFFMGKSTMSMVIFNRKLLVYQRVWWMTYRLLIFGCRGAKTWLIWTVFDQHESSIGSLPMRMMPENPNWDAHLVFRWYPLINLT